MDQSRSGRARRVEMRTGIRGTTQRGRIGGVHDALFADRSPEERKALMGEAKLDAILKDPKRIAQISEDIA